MTVQCDDVGVISYCAADQYQQAPRLDHGGIAAGRQGKEVRSLPDVMVDSRMAYITLESAGMAATSKFRLLFTKSEKVVSPGV